MKFEVGKSYKVRWIGEADLKDSRKVIKRTEKTVILERGGIKKVFNDGEGEYCYPEGRYLKARVMRTKGVIM